MVGLVAGAIGAAAFRAAAAAGLPPLLASFWTVGVLMLLTGALHEDGLADTADGFGGGRTPARKLEIMRDSRIGSYGALALLLSVGLRVSALAAFATPEAGAAALAAAAVLGRGAIVGVICLLAPARPDGLGAALRDAPAARRAAGLALAAVLVCVLLPPRAAAAALLGAAVTAGATAWLASRQTGGYTGDVLGAAEQATECVVLSCLAAMQALAPI